MINFFSDKLLILPPRPESSWVAHRHCLWKVIGPISRVDKIIWLGKYTRNLSILSIILVRLPAPYTWLTLLTHSRCFFFWFLRNLYHQLTAVSMAIDSYLPPFLNPALPNAWRSNSIIQHNIRQGVLGDTSFDFCLPLRCSLLDCLYVIWQRSRRSVY